MTLIVFLLAFMTFLVAILNILPTAQLPADIASSFAYLAGSMKAWGFLLPINTLFYAAGFVVAVDLILLGWWVAEWLIGLVRGSTT